MQMDDRYGQRGIKKIGAMMVLLQKVLPAVMFSAFATAEYSLKSVCVPLTMFAVCCGALFLGFCCAGG